MPFENDSDNKNNTNTWVFNIFIQFLPSTYKKSPTVPSKKLLNSCAYSHYEIFSLILEL